MKVYKAYAAAYVLYAAILFFATDFIYGRLVLISGFTIGLAGLRLSRGYVLPYIETILSKKKEGPRKIILKNSSGKTDPAAGRIETEIASILKQKRVKLPDPEEAWNNRAGTLAGNVEENSTLGDDWGSRLISEFRNNRLKSANGPATEKVEQMK